MTRDQSGESSWTRSPSTSHQILSPRGAEFQNVFLSATVRARYPPCSDGRNVRITGPGIFCRNCERCVGVAARQSRRNSITSAHSTARAPALRNESRSFSHRGTQMRGLLAALICIEVPSGCFDSEMTRGSFSNTRNWRAQFIRSSHWLDKRSRHRRRGH